MPVFTIKTPRGDEVDIDAPDEATAIHGAQSWDHQDWATSEAGRLGVDPDLVLRQMGKESSGNQGAVSPKGASGLMQLMPATAKELGVDPSDPYQNITGGITYLKQQLDRFSGDKRLALAAYNAGPGAVERAGGVPNYPETRDYVDTLAGPEGASGGPQSTTGPDGAIQIEIDKSTNPEFLAWKAAQRAGVQPIDPVTTPAATPVERDPKSLGYQLALDKERELERLRPQDAFNKFGESLTAPFNDEISGLVAGGLQFGENRLRELAGKPIEITTKDRARAATEVERARAAKFREEHPVLGNVGPLIGGLVAGPGAPEYVAAKNIAMPAWATAAGLGGVYGAADAEGGLPDRVVGAGLGAGAGLAMHAGGSALAQSPVGRKLGDMVAKVFRRPIIDPADVKVGQVVANAVDRSGRPLADVIQNLRDLPEGTPGFHADESLGDLAEILAQSPGPARRMVTDSVYGHQAGATDRVSEDLNRTLNGKGDFLTTRQQMREQRAANSKPMMDEALATPIDTAAFEEHVAPLLHRLPKGALNNAYDIARVEGVPAKDLHMGFMDNFDGYNAAGPATPEQVDAADLGALRRGVQPKMNQGDSLLAFISKNGGVRDYGGELRARDADLWHRQRPFLKKLLREDGLSAEAMAQKAHDAGYFPEKITSTADDAESYHPVTAEDLYSAVSDELAGSPRYARAPDPQAEARAGRLDSLEGRLRDAGVNPRDISPREAGKALGQAADDEARLSAHLDGDAAGAAPDVQPTYGEEPNMRALHYLKLGLEQHLAQYRNPVTGKLEIESNPRATAEAGLRRQLGIALRKVSQPYNAAMASWGDDSEQIHALNVGRNVLKDDINMSAEQLRQAYGEWSDEAKDMYRKGIGEGILAKARSPVGGVGAARQMLKSKEVGDRVRIAFPSDEAFNSFMSRMKRQVIMEGLNNKITGGAPTYRRQAARADLEQQGTQMADVAAELGEGILNPASIPGKSLKAMLKSMPRKDRSIIGDQKLNAKAGAAIKDPKELLRLIELQQKRLKGTPNLSGYSGTEGEATRRALAGS